MRIKDGLLRACLVAVVITESMIVGGCINLPAAIAPSNVPLNPGEYTEVGPAKGSSYSVMLYIIPISEGSTKKAVTRALADSGGDALVGVTADCKIYPCILVNVYETRVEGIAVRKLKNK